jgi:hypothetical protein
MKVRRRGTGIIQLLSIPPINLDLNMFRDRGTQVTMNRDIPTVEEMRGRNMIEKIHQLGGIGNQNIALKLILMNMTTKTIIIVGRNHINITDHDLIHTYRLHFLFEDTRHRRVFRYLIKCLISVICHYQEGTPGRGLGLCNMLLLQVLLQDMAEGD